VHAKERSACAVVGEEDQIQAAIAQGLDAIAFTDHHRLVPKNRLVQLNERYAPFKIFSGIEITADEEDWLVLGLSDPTLERWNWHYPDLAAFVRRLGGFIALAHPFRFADYIQVNINSLPPDGIEVRSVNTRSEREGEIRKIAARLHLAPLQNSDAHSTNPIGRYYNLLPDVNDGDAGLVANLMTLKEKM
jgi:hypothetical protein